MPRLLITRRIPEAGLTHLRGQCDFTMPEAAALPDRHELLAAVRGIDGLLCLLTEKIDEELLDAAGPGLKVVSTMSVGYDHIDLAACRKRGIAVGHTPDVLTETSADLTLALMLATARRLPEAWTAVKDGSWGPWQPEWLTGMDLHGAQVGIIGMGRIGAAVGRRLRGFGCQLLYSAPRPQPERAELLAARYCQLPELLAVSDVVTLHSSLNPGTRHLINRETLALMKKDAILINTSRGDAIDQEALLQALRSGHLRAAGLDVTTPEPLPPDHPLLALPNCLILPHIGSASTRTRNQMAIIAASNALAGMAGQALPHPVRC